MCLDFRGRDGIKSRSVIPLGAHRGTHVRADEKNRENNRVIVYAHASPDKTPLHLNGNEGMYVCCGPFSFAQWR